MSPHIVLVESLPNLQAQYAHVQVLHVHKDGPGRDSSLHGS